jgi:hypothetical protein
MIWVWTKPLEIHLVFPQAWEELFNTCWDKFCVLAGMGGIWSTHVQMHFVSSLLWAGFAQSKLSYIFCLRIHGVGLINTGLDAF